MAHCAAPPAVPQVYCALAALPWAGSALAGALPEGMERFSAEVEQYLVRTARAQQELYCNAGQY